MNVAVNNIQSVLSQIKYTISRGSDYFIFRSDIEKNKETLIRLGFTPYDAISILYNLTEEDYVKGPETNISGTVNRHNEEIWIFGKEVEGLEIMEVYIKFSLVSDKASSMCVCVSFHEAKYDLEYPFKS